MLDDSTARRLWARVDKSGGPDACWPWMGAKGTGRNTYGNIGVRRRTERTHRIAWVVTNGSIPEGLAVLHRCDNPPCCNPAHLFLGTIGENNADRASKGRNNSHLRSGDANGMRTHPECVRRGDENPSRKYPERLKRGDDNGSRRYPERLPRGEANHNAKLTESCVRSIRSLRVAGVTQVALAKRYGVSPSLIRAVVAREIWKHVE